MIFEPFLELVYQLLKVIFSVIPDVPSLDIAVLADLNNFVNLIFNNVGLLGFFIDIDTVKVLVPLLIIVLNFEQFYHFFIWCLNKIPYIDLD